MSRRKTKNKKAQVTIFIVIGITMLVAVILIFYVGRLLKIEGLLREGGKIDPNLEPINSRVEKCMEDLADKGLETIGLQGGKITLRKDSYLETDYGKLAYLGKHSQNLVPSDMLVEKELALFMADNLKECTEDFAFQPHQVKQDNMKVKAEIGGSKVIFEVQWPLTLIKEGREYKKGFFRYETPEKDTPTKKMIRLGQILDAARELAENRCATRDIVNSIFNKDPRIHIDYINYQDDILYKIEDNGYIFRFAINRCRV